MLLFVFLGFAVDSGWGRRLWRDRPDAGLPGSTAGLCVTQHYVDSHWPGGLGRYTEKIQTRFRVNVNSDLHPSFIEHACEGLSNSRLTLSAEMYVGA